MIDPEKMKNETLNVGESQKLLDGWLADKVINEAKEAANVVDLEAARDLAVESIRKHLGAVALDPTTTQDLLSAASFGNYIVDKFGVENSFAQSVVSAGSQVAVLSAVEFVVTGTMTAGQLAGVLTKMDLSALTLHLHVYSINTL